VPPRITKFSAPSEKNISKPVKQEAYHTVILPLKVFPVPKIWFFYFSISCRGWSTRCAPRTRTSRSSSTTRDTLPFTRIRADKI